MIMKKIYFLIGIFFIAPVFAEGTIEITPMETNMNRVVPRNAVRLPLSRVQLKAGDSDVFVSGMEFVLQGFSAPSDFGRVWIETSRFQRSRRTSVQTDNTLIFRFSSPILLEKNKLETITLYGNLKMKSPGTGRYFSFSPSAIESDATRVTLGIQTAARQSVTDRRVRRRGGRVRR